MKKIDKMDILIFIAGTLVVLMITFIGPQLEWKTRLLAAVVVGLGLTVAAKMVTE